MADSEECYIPISPESRDRSRALWGDFAERLGGVMPERNVKVTLVADTSAYDAAMKRAEKRARKLAKALRDLHQITIHIRTEREHG